MSKKHFKVAFRPKQVYEDFANNKLSKDAATDLLISLIDSPNGDIRRKSIEVFLKLSLKSDKAFRIIENYFISDESALVRKVAAQVIFYNFPKKKNFLPLKYAVHYEKSPIVIRELLDMFESVNDDPHFLIFTEQINKRLKKVYNVPIEEIYLFLNLEVIYIEYANDYNFIAGDTWFKIIGMLKNLSNTTGLIQKIYYLKLGGKRYTSLPHYSLSHLKDLLLNIKNT